MGFRKIRGKITANVRNIRFVIVGVGGTGSYTFYYLSRLIAAQNLTSVNNLSRSYQIVIADGDVVEEKNLIRQNYVKKDIGRPKVEVLSERYGNVYNMSIPYYPNYVETEDKLKELLYEIKSDFWPEASVLISCVDNNRSRQLFHKVFYESEKPIVYIDSGNDEWSGQVFCGIKNKKVILPPVGHFYPDILSDSGRFPSELSCEERQVSSPQNMATNIMAATLIFSMINQLFFGEGLEICGATFNAKTGLVRPIWIQDTISSIRIAEG